MLLGVLQTPSRLVPCKCNAMQVGKKSRTVGKTLMNEDSSRSHSIFTLTVEGMTPKSEKVRQPQAAPLPKLAIVSPVFDDLERFSSRIGKMTLCIQTCYCTSI